VLTWGLPPERVTVVPNASPPPAELPPREELRATYGIDGPTLAFAGRLTAAKALDVAFEAIAELDDVTLLVAGDGEERARLEASAGARARFLGPLPRERVLELLAVADAVLLSSSWENFPHVLVEALSVGTPVIATRVGGVPEIVEDGVNGLLVPAGDPHALAAAVRRFYADGELRARLTAAALPSASRFSPGVVMDELEATLARFARTSSH
jgi:glycosyltransferase involved in cell wall biosynthesis